MDSIAMLAVNVPQKNESNYNDSSSFHPSYFDVDSMIAHKGLAPALPNESGYSASSFQRSYSNMETLPPVLPPVPQNDDDDDSNNNEYMPELLAQFTNVDNLSQTTGRSNREPGSQKRVTKRPAEQQDVAQDNNHLGDNQSGESLQSHLGSNDLSGHNQLGGSSQSHFGSFFGIGDADLFDLNTLNQFDNLDTFYFPGVVSSAYTGVNVHGNVNNNISDSCQMINLQVENANIHMQGAPLPINDVSSYLGSVTGGLPNDLFVDTPLNNTLQGRATQQIPEAFPMMPIFYNRHPSWGTQGSYPANLLLPEGAHGPQPTVPPTRSNVKRQRQSQSPSPPPQKKIRIVHDELSMPSDFRANPDNHARFRYNQDGTREYLNAPKKKRRKRPRQCLG